MVVGDDGGPGMELGAPETHRQTAAMMNGRVQSVGREGERPPGQGVCTAGRDHASHNHAILASNSTPLIRGACQ